MTMTADELTECLLLSARNETIIDLIIKLKEEYAENKKIISDIMNGEEFNYRNAGKGEES